MRQPGRLDEVVLHSISRSNDLAVFEPRERSDYVVLHRFGQRHRQPVDVDRLRLQAFRLEMQLVPLPVREPHDLVFEGRAVARTDPCDPSVVQRAGVDAPAHDVVRRLRGVERPAGDLVRRGRRAGERKRDRRLIAVLLDESSCTHVAFEVDAAPIEARRRSGLQAARLQVAPPKAGRELSGRCLAVPAFRLRNVADVRPAIEERARGDHNRGTSQGRAAPQHHRRRRRCRCRCPPPGRRSG